MSYRSTDIAALTAAALDDLESAREKFSYVEDEVQIASAHLLSVKLSLEWLIIGVEVRQQSLTDAMYLNDERTLDPDFIEKPLMNLLAFCMKVCENIKWIKEKRKMKTIRIIGAPSLPTFLLLILYRFDATPFFFNFR